MTEDHNPSLVLSCKINYMDVLMHILVFCNTEISLRACKWLPCQLVNSVFGPTVTHNLQDSKGRGRALPESRNLQCPDFKFLTHRQHKHVNVQISNAENLEPRNRSWCSCHVDTWLSNSQPFKIWLSVYLEQPNLKPYPFWSSGASTKIRKRCGVCNYSFSLVRWYSSHSFSAQSV